MLLFLDIDGVMVPAKSWKRPELLSDGFPAFSGKAAHVLQALVKADTTVVLTTSHKSNFTIGEWKDIFRKRGIEILHLERLPANVLQQSRKDEILNWFNVNAVRDDFVIIDDDSSLHDLPGFLKENVVQTSPQIGLTDEHLALAKSLLAKQRASHHLSE